MWPDVDWGGLGDWSDCPRVTLDDDYALASVLARPSIHFGALLSG